MPPSPEIGEADGGVGETKIIFQMKPETEGAADGAGRVAGKIKKYLTGEREDADPGIERDERPAVSKNAIGRA